MKIAMLQLNPTVGDCIKNTDAIIDAYHKACASGASLVVAPEHATVGYPPQDLLLAPAFIDLHNRELARLVRAVGDTGLIVGIIEESKGVGKPLYNTAVLIRHHAIMVRQKKTLLPTYDVFDERRYFKPNTGSVWIFDYRGHKTAMLVCEDIWGGSEDGEKLYRRDPVSELAREHVDLLVTVNASPYYHGKGNIRAKLVSGIARKLNANVIYVNQVGGNDTLVFDGRSFAVNRQGECIGSVAPFVEGIGMVTLNESTRAPYPCDGGVGDLYVALVLGLKDYMHKSGRYDAVLGLSGGIDSALTACIAVDALGREHVRGYAMPSPFSSQGSIDDAQALAKNLGITCDVINLSGTYRAYKEMLCPIIGWDEPGATTGDVTEENIQARIRGNILMAVSNRKGSIVLTTGNKSEIAVGYCTLYGDTAGGFAVISDVPKMEVYTLAAYVNRDREIIPQNTITKKPSAELRPGQVDQDSLPPYDVLDAILEAYVEKGLSVEDIVKTFPYDEYVVRWVVGKVDGNEYKRRQLPPGLKVTKVAFGTGRRMPIVARVPSLK